MIAIVIQEEEMTKKSKSQSVQMVTHGFNDRKKKLSKDKKNFKKFGRKKDGKT